RDDASYGRLIAEARRYALVSFDEAQGSVQMHRVVLGVIRESLPVEMAKLYRRQVHVILAAANPGDSDRIDTWPAFDGLWPHVAPSRAVTSTDGDVRHLVLDVVRYLFRRGDYASSSELAESALRSWTERWPEDDYMVLIAKIFLANAVRPQSEYARARQL